MHCISEQVPGEDIVIFYIFVTTFCLTSEDIRLPKKQEQLVHDDLVTL